MNKLPLLITDYADILARAAFDPNADCTLETFDGVAAKYRFEDKVRRPCQTQKPAGRCNNPHFDGWLIKTTEGKEVLVGSVCGPDYFQTDSRFKADTSRIQREIETADVLGRLEALTAQPDLEQRIATELARVRRIRERIQVLQAELPGDVATKLTNMARTGNARVFIEIQYEERNEKREVVKREWVPVQYGTVAHAGLFRDQIGLDLIDALKAARDAAQEVVVDRSTPLRKLKRWLAALEPISTIRSPIDELERMFESFCTPNNVRPLIFVSGNHDHRLRLAALTLRFGGSDESEADSLLRSLETAVLDQYDNRNFRSAH